MLAVKILLIFVEAVCSLLLIGVILLQKSKGEGLGLAFGAQMGESLFGARASNVLVKITIWLGIIFLVNTTFLANMYSHGRARSLMERKAPREQPASPVYPPPAAPEATRVRPITPLPAPVPTPQADSAPVSPTVPLAPPASAPVSVPAPATKPQEKPES